MNNFIDTPLEEQEVNINIDYMKRRISAYTSRKTIFYRWIKRLGEPEKIYYIRGKITGGKWVIPFADSRVKSTLSKTLLIGGLSNSNKKVY